MKNTKLIFLILVILGLVLLLVCYCKKSKCNSHTNNDESEIGQSEIDISFQEVPTNDEIETNELNFEGDTFTSSPGFASGPGTIGFGRYGSSFGN